jgi:protein SCO1
MLRALRYVLWAAVGAAAVVLLAAWMGWPNIASRVSQPAFTVADIGGRFTLTNHKGQSVSNADLKGTPYALFFGFTHCPDVCPTTLWELSELLKKLGPDADRLNIFFVTVDPERDTVEALANYLSAFDPRIVGLTGKPEQIEAMVKAYRAYSKKVPTNSGGYTMDHTAVVYLMSWDGRFSGTLDRHEQANIQLEKLCRLIDKSRSF